MMLKKNGVLFIFLLFAFTKLNAQEPAHFFLGEEELAGLDIYDILQDKNQHYWIATDQGLIKYDGYTYKHLKVEKALSNSAFDLQMDYNNELYFKNLSGQIFHVKNDICQLYFQLPDSLMHPHFYYAFDNNNDLIIATTSILKITTKKKIELIEKSLNNGYFMGFTTLKDSSLLCTTNNNKNITWKNNVLTVENCQFQKKKFYIGNFNLNNKLHHFDFKSGKLLTKNKKNYSIAKNTSVNPNNEKKLKYYIPVNQHLFIANQTGGMQVYDKNLKPLFHHQIIFKNTFISTIHQDHEGNFLLGTFGKGIIVLPDLELKNIALPDINAKASCITSSKEYIFIGLQDGRIYSIDTNCTYKMLWDIKSKKVETLEYIKGSNGLIIDGMANLLIDLKTAKTYPVGFSSIKDVKKMALNKYLVSSNGGLHALEINKVNNSAEPEISRKSILKLRLRTNCANYDSLTDTYYAGTSSGLKMINEDSCSYFKLNESTPICSEIINHNNKIYTATNNGILVFQKNKLIAHWKKEDGLLSNRIKQLTIFNEQLYLSTKNGLQILSLKGKTKGIFNKTNGLLENNILDFEIKDDAISFVFQKGIQTIKLKALYTSPYIPKIKISAIAVNDSIIFADKDSTFNYKRNKFEFHVASPSVKYKNEISYYYKIDGIDENWQINPYLNNSILYKTLPPGKYTFEVKAVFRNHESKTLNYHFTITPPYWKTWWFYACSILLFIGIAILLFIILLKRQKKKIQMTNELNASKLIAIQSQMNPHFIFNAINSIQDLILKGDIDNSYSYIIKFSKLVRQTLNFSDKSFIDIEEEVELLKVYLELEKLRFKADFEYTINTNGINDLQVPPMLVQPFVENAIKHGLLHKEGLKKLNISFHKNTVLKCIVTDNGIGRKKSKEINDRKRKNYQSFSVNATKNRFNIMKTHYQQDLGIEFDDLKENNLPIGTKVTIYMPFKQNY